MIVFLRGCFCSTAKDNPRTSCNSIAGLKPKTAVLSDPSHLPLQADPPQRAELTALATPAEQNRQTPHEMRPHLRPYLNAAVARGVDREQSGTAEAWQCATLCGHARRGNNAWEV